MASASLPSLLERAALVFLAEVVRIRQKRPICADTTGALYLLIFVEPSSC